MKTSAVFVFSFCCVFLLHGILEAEKRGDTNDSEFRYISDNMLENDPYRTAYHFQPLRNWMNGLSLD